MLKLWPVFIAALVLAGLSELASAKQVEPNGKTVYLRKDRVFYIILVIVLSVFVGLRTKYNDTLTYTYAYELYGTGIEAIKSIDWAVGSNPGFNFVNICLKTIGFSAQDFLMFYAVVTNAIYLWFIRKYTNNIWLAVFLFITMGNYTFTMAAIKQCVAVALCLIATELAIRKKWVAFVIIIVLACLFHPYSFMFLAVPLLIFKPWTSKTYVWLAIFALLGVSLQTLLGTLVNITSMMGETYDVQEFSGEGVNIFRVAVVWAPVILSFGAKKFWRKSNDSARNMIMNVTTLNAEIMFIALFGTANYFARLANYFLIFQCIALPYMLEFFEEKSRRVMTGIIVICYFAYFYYSEAILYGGFDSLFKGIDFMSYLQTIL